MEYQTAGGLLGVSSMKREFKHPSLPQTGRTYWRSLEEYSDTPEFRDWLTREFPAGAAEFESDDPLSRRSFMQLMTASMALAGLGLTGCRRPEAHVVPYTKSVEWQVPGRALQYATAMPRRGGAMPLMTTTFDGRPTKIEGNPLLSGFGGTDTYAQASVLDLYDPDRSRSFLRDRTPIDAAEFFKHIAELRAELDKTGGQGFAVLAESGVSPTRERLRRKLSQKYPRMIWSTYDPVSDENSEYAAEIAYGGRYRFVPAYDKASIVFSLDADFLSCEQGTVSSIRQFVSRRRVKTTRDSMNRLYVVETRFTSTGGFADHRLRLAAGKHKSFISALARELAAQGAGGAIATVAGGLPSEMPDGVDPAWIKESARDLIAHRGSVLFVAGRHEHRDVHLIAMAINQTLGAPGVTFKLMPVFEPRGIPVTDLARRINEGEIKTLVVLGGNPVYNAPVDLNWAEVQKKVPQVIRHGYYDDETSDLAAWHVPAAHYLESWGDARAEDGTVLSIQPMILPLFGGISEIEMLAAMSGEPRPQGPELVRETLTSMTGADGWKKFVHDGFLAGSATGSVSADFRSGLAADYLRPIGKPKADVSEGNIEIVFYADPSVDDGRYVNNGWMQELPDPVTKLTWDNAALVSPATAKKLGLKSKIYKGWNSDVIRVNAGFGDMEIPILIAPGHADDSISIALGYGRVKTGRVGSGVGVDAYRLRSSANSHFAAAARVEKTGETRRLAITQEHFSMEGRNLVREATLDEYRDNPRFAAELGIDAHLPGSASAAYNNPSLPPDPKSPAEGQSKHQWGMVIDLNSCVGCNACMVACQSENNVPIVGKEQVIRGREMHWLRIDRYFSSDAHDDHGHPEDAAPADPLMMTEPVLCMQCDNAPCETVCPVNATVHNDEGLNVMAYNRCIGTRYCANNCPYKVRRFNYFDYNKRRVDGNNLYLGPLGEKNDPMLVMQKNPNVSVRMRGVMEKCTFCVQRIETSKINQLAAAKDSPNTIVAADSVKTACQQACPAEAIVFGNLADSNSQVAKLRGVDREYALLAYLNTKPRVTYLARLKNPNQKMPGADRVGLGSGGHA